MEGIEATQGQYLSSQVEFDVRCEWGEQGIIQLAPISDAIVIIDVLSFSTCIDIANSRGAIIFPYQWQSHSALEFARSIGAELAEKRGSSRYSLSPASLLHIAPETRLILPSPNGSSLSLATATTPTLTGCLRNCQAVALAAMKYGKKIAVIPAGERWSDGSIRPAFEDFIGAGAVIHYLEGTRSPEAGAAVSAYRGVCKSLATSLEQCSSGKELIERGFKRDVNLAAEAEVSNCVPTLINGAYVNGARELFSSL